MRKDIIYSLKGVSKTYQPDGCKALNEIEFDIYREEIFGLVGESGSGKSTCARVVSGLDEVDSGQCFFEGKDISHLSERELFSLRREIQFVFQDPCAALNPMHRIVETLLEPLRLHSNYMKSRKPPLEEIASLLEKVGLPLDVLSRFPHQFSGGAKTHPSLETFLSKFFFGIIILGTLCLCLIGSGIGIASINTFV
nr:ATP-binding cassette domain-containing protein [Candidatus Similichlamydia epinepheli]